MIYALYAILFSSAFADTSPLPKAFSFRCVSTMPSTSYLGEVKGDQFQITVIHHNGMAFLPIHEGIVVPHDFKYLNQKADILTKMRDQDTFNYPLDRCKYYGKSLFSCAGGEKKAINGVTFEALNFDNSRIVEDTYGMHFEKIRMSMSLFISGLPVQEVPMQYYGEECKFTGEN